MARKYSGGSLSSKIDSGGDAFITLAIVLLIAGAVLTSLTGVAATIMNTIFNGFSSAVTTFAAPFFVIVVALLIYGLWKRSQH